MILESKSGGARQSFSGALPPLSNSFRLGDLTRKSDKRLTTWSATAFCLVIILAHPEWGAFTCTASSWSPVAVWHIVAKAYNTCVAPQASYRSCSGAVHVTDRVGVQLMGRRLSMRSQTDLRPTSRTPPWSAVKLSVPRNPWITTHFPTPERWKVELTWLVDPLRTFHPRSAVTRQQ